jgi:hypothetical protein
VIASRAHGRGPAGGFTRGDSVRVLTDRAEGNPRTPGYARGRTGVVIREYGIVENPLDHRTPYPPMYSVQFDLDRPGDQIVAELHEDWLERAN